MINQLPKSYKEINYKTYVEIINKVPAEKPEDIDPAEWSRTVHLITLSVLLGVSPATIEGFKAIKVAELIKSISFLDEPITPAKNAFKVKSLDEITYDEFSTYQRLRLDQWNNLDSILLIFLKDATEESIEQMSIYDVMQVFFCLSKSTRKSLTRLKFLTIKTLIAKIARQTLLFWKTRKDSPN